MSIFLAVFAKGEMMKQFAYPKLMRYFEEISAIPRASAHEEKIADYLVAFAENKGFSVLRDEWNNVLITAPATEGIAHCAPVLLQGHTDMVCEKNAGVVHDFSKDPLSLYEEDGWLHARGTTLGADNGVALAVMLAILDGEAHPPLECLFTTSEEIGLDGALGFDYERISARRMINMDGADDAEIIVGSAGGACTELSLHGTKTPTERLCIRLSLRGLMGGHSGEDIHRGRANANCLLGEILGALGLTQRILLVSVDGGSKDNAIPREAEAVLSVADFDVAKVMADEVWRKLRRGLCAEDANAELLLTRCEESYPCFDDAMTEKIISLLSGVPNGVFSWEPTLPGLVQFSRNLGVVRTEGEQITLTFSSRSAKEEQVKQSLSSLDELAERFGGVCHHHGAYPGWEVAEHSELRTQYAEVYRRLFAREVRVASIHAGLECGVIKKAIPDMDLLSCGPVIENLHSPDERLQLASFERFYRLMTELLKSMK